MNSVNQKIGVCIVSLGILCTPLFSFAIGLLPFGGRVVSVKTPPTAQCGISMTSPFIIIPSAGSAGPWSTLPGPVNVGQITPNAWILGLILPGTGLCVEGMSSTPFPTTTTNFYGTSISL